MSAVKQAVALLRDEHLVWSEDMEVVRRPLADLLEAIGNNPSHAFDDQVDELLLPLLGIEPSNAPRDPMEAWISDAYRHLNQIGAVAEKSPSFAEALKKLFNLL